MGLSSELIACNCISAMFALGLFGTTCCAADKCEGVERVMVITDSEHAYNAVEALPSATKKTVTFKADYADIEECSTMASEGNPDSETCSSPSHSDETTSASGKKPTSEPRLRWDDVIDRCRVPTWDDAITSAWEKTVKAAPFAGAWDDAVQGDSRPTPMSRHEIKKPPELLMVQSPGKDRTYNGAYSLCRDQRANGMALWKHVTAEYWIYSCTKGKWCIGGRDVAMDRFERASGFLYQNSQHRGASPDAVEGGWHFWDESESRFRMDPTIFVKTMY